MAETVRGGAEDRDYPLDPVPVHKRRGMPSLLVMLVSFLFFGPTMVAGGQVAVHFAYGEFLMWAAVSAAILAAYVAVLGTISARTGLTPVLLARHCLGRAGGTWASIVLGGTQIGWYGVTVGVLGDMLGRVLGLDSTWPLTVVFGLLMGVSAYFGYRGLEILSWVSVPLMLVLCVWAASRALGEVGGWQPMLAAEGGGAGISAGAALTIMIGTFVSGGTQAGNWTRFARTGRAAFAASAVAVLACQLLMLGFGGIGAAAFGEPDFAAALLQMGLLSAGVLLLVTNLWTTNDNAAYSFGVAGAALFRVADKRPFVIGGVVLGTGIALAGLHQSLEGFLVLLGVAIPPIGGAVIGQYYLAWRGRLDPQAPVPVLRIPGAAAYLAGTAAAAATTALDLGVPALTGIAVSILAAPFAAALGRALPPQREPAEQPAQ
ncbi:cytosine permease [Nocardiopsis coralliicola]